MFVLKCYLIPPCVWLENYPTPINGLWNLESRDNVGCVDALTNGVHLKRDAFTTTHLYLSRMLCSKVISQTKLALQIYKGYWLATVLNPLE